MSIKKHLVHLQKINVDQENSILSSDSKSSSFPTYKIDGFTQFQPIIDRYTQVIDDLLAENSNYKKQTKLLKNQIKELQQQYAQQYILNENAPQERQLEIVSLEQKITKFQSQMVALKRQLKFCEQQLNYKNQQLKDLKKQNQSLRQIISKIQQQEKHHQIDRQKQVRESQSEFNRTIKQLHQLKQTIKQIENQKRQQYIQLKTKTDKITKLQQQIHTLNSENTYLHQKLKKQSTKSIEKPKRSQLSANRRQINNVQQQNKINKNEILQLKTEIAKLQEQKINIKQLLYQQNEIHQKTKNQKSTTNQININAKSPQKTDKNSQKVQILQRQLAKLKRQLDSIHKQQTLHNKKKITENHKFKSLIHEYETEKENFQKQINTLTIQNNQLKQQLQQMSLQIEMLKNSQKIYIEKYTKSQNQQNLSSKILQKKYQELISERNCMMKEIDALKLQLQQQNRNHQQQIKKINDKIRDHQENNARMKKQMHLGHKQNLQQLVLQIQRLQNINQQISNKYQQASSQLAQCKKIKQHTLQQLQQQLTKKNTQIQVLCYQLQQAIKRINISILTQQQKLQKQSIQTQKQYQNQKEILALKMYYEKQVKQLVSQINNLTQTCNRLYGENQRYLKCQAQLEITKRKLQQPLLGVNIQHLWSIKDIQYQKIIQSIRQLRN